LEDERNGTYNAIRRFGNSSNRADALDCPYQCAHSAYFCLAILEWNFEALRELGAGAEKVAPGASAETVAMTFGALHNEIAGSHTDQEWSDLVRRSNWRCFYCAKPVCKNSLDPNGELTKDHLIPKSRGGVDFIGNIVPACVRCNSLKGTKTVKEFRAVRASYLPSSVQKKSETYIGAIRCKEQPSDAHLEEVPVTVQPAEIGAMWTDVVAAMVTKRGMTDQRPDSWWEHRRAILKRQAQGIKRLNLEAAGQLTLPIFGDNSPRISVENDTQQTLQQEQTL
jgi:hypothetical protein